MTITNLETAITAVTFEQIDRCHRVYDLNNNTAFYLVENEAGEVDEHGVIEYKVTHTKQYGYQCTCKAGQEGFAHCTRYGVCKHCVWAVAAAREFHANEGKEQGDIATLQGSGVALETATALAYSDFPTVCEQYTEIVDLTLTSAHSLQWIDGPNGYRIPA